MRKRIAVIGSGISGLVSAHRLSERYDVFMFEESSYIGGHTHTVKVNVNHQIYSIDTGFIVFNQKTYPNFCRLLNELGVKYQESEMSFSFRSDGLGIEYSGNNIDTLFADRSNLLNIDFYKMLKDIVRFNLAAKKFLASTTQDMTINEFLIKNHYGKLFAKAYFIPMVSAIWSSKSSEIYSTSARYILHFFDNHGLLNILNRPKWYVVANGSHSYIQPLTKNYGDQIRLNSKVESIRRSNNQVILQVASSESMTFDAAFIATHSDQALRLLADPTPLEESVLSAIKYQDNDVILHSDTSILPKNRRAWASWNYLDNAQDVVGLTYYMNRLQNIISPIDFCVSVNQAEWIQPDNIFERFTYSHPCFTREAIRAQQQHTEINGKLNTYYCGAYWGYGFHEDGVNSAIKACADLGTIW